MLKRIARSRFARNAVTLQFAALLNAGSQLLSSIALAHVLGAHEQGRFVVCSALYAIFYLVLNVFGVSQATVSQVAAASARGLHDKVTIWLAFLAKANLVLGSIVIVLGWLTLPWLAGYWDEGRTFGIWAWWLTFTTVLEMPRWIVSAGFQGTRRMVALAQTENMTEIIRLFLVVVGALVTGSPLGPIVATVATAGISSVIALQLYHNARRDGGPPLPAFIDVLRGMRAIPLLRGLPLGLRLGLVRNLDSLSLKTLPPLIIDRFASTSAVAYFRIAQNTTMLPLMLMQGVSRTALPALSELAGLRDLARFRRLFIRATLLSGAVISAGILIGLPFIKLLLHAAYPADYFEPSWRLVKILSAGCVILSFAVAFDSFYIVTNRLRVALILAIVGLPITMVSFAVLVIRLPETGAAWGIFAIYSLSVVHYAYIALYFWRQVRDERAAAASPECASSS